MLALPSAEALLRAALAGIADAPGSALSLPTLPAWVEAVAVAMAQSPQDCVLIAQHGLAALLDGATYTRPGCASVPLSEAPALPESFALMARVVQGSGIRPNVDELARVFRSKAESWVAQGLVSDSVQSAAATPAMWDLAGVEFVVFGALDPLAPTRTLLELGAAVLAIDGSNDKAWADLLAWAAEKCSGTLVVACVGDSPGCSVVEHLPEVARFVLSNLRTQQPVLGSFIDARQLQEVACCDALIEYICAALPSASLAWWSSPDEVHVVSHGPLVVTEREMQRAKVHGTKTFTAVRFGRVDDSKPVFALQRCVVGESGGIDAHAGLLVRRWRAVVARQLGTYQWLADKRRHVVSAPILPSRDLGREATLLMINDLRGSPPLLDNPLQLFNRFLWNRL